MSKKRMFAIAALIFIVAFIWGNSLVPGKASMALSNHVLTDLGGTVTRSPEEAREATTFLNSTNIRKLGHALEFMLLGGIAAVVVPLNREKWPVVALLCVWVAVLDETIQMFFARTPAIVDVWIDLGGVFCGALLGWCFLKVMKGLCRRPKTK